ncbi:SDR family NAD(P)-dependent oxidoreductase [Halorarum halobium]|uniref:SDR family NAD(P)-dependent oxidoreductase n=1 Tax=Halorarum halobium TaxID=3075121 RepID=UPI0028A85BA6|nr:SDR family NAD(P)-dependent oxidoreductase [Halobaculum sp. XH14]
MDPAVDGATVVVTGGASGIGRATARAYAEHGATVVIADVAVDDGEAAVRSITEDGGTATFVETDVTDREHVASLLDAAADEFGGVDVVISNAGGSAGDDALHRLDVETWTRMIELNLGSHFLLAREALPHLVDSEIGSITFTSSVNGVTGIGLVGYSAAKSGLFGLSRVIAAQYGRHGVRSNVVCPGTIQSEALAAKREAEWSEELHDLWYAQYPLGRFGRPEEVADAMLFVGSRLGSFLTGTELVVDGGLSTSLDGTLLDSMYDLEELSRDD